LPRDQSGLTATDEVRRRLGEARRRRGYLLPHQGVMAAALPELQDAYPAMYQALTGSDHHLSLHEKECVWLGILIACQEHVGTHHIVKFREGGGTNAQARAIFQLTSFSLGAPAVYGFLDHHWAQHFDVDDVAPLYRTAIGSICDAYGLNPSIGLLTALGVHTAFSHEWGVKTAIRLCYGADVHEGKIAEAISLALWPCGMNRFVTAAFIWRDLILAGQVPASAPFQEWARTPDQDGLSDLQRP
jgi:alkylhydroperoxidase/carboxymuconolactone decarboxylase family protein YurZ